MKSNLVFFVVTFFMVSQQAFSDEKNWWEQYNKNKNNLVMNLTFEEGKGQVTKDIISAKNAEIKNCEWTEGKKDLPLIFNGENSFSVADSPSLHLNKNFSIEVWCYPESLDGGYVLIKKYSYGFPAMSGENKVSCYLRLATDKDKVITIPDICEVNKWQHYVMTYDGEKVRIYYNGNIMSSYVTSMNIDVAGSDNPVLIGNCGGWGSKNFSGKVGLARIYNNVLNDEDIKKNYQGLVSNEITGKSEKTVMEIPSFPGINTGNALSFNGENSYVEVADDPKLNLDTGFTIGAWIRPEKVLPNRYIVSKNSGNHAGYAIASHYDNGFSGLIITEEGPFSIIVPGALGAGQWTHVALTWDGKLAQLYVDGQPVGKPVMTKGKLKPFEGPVHIGKAADRDDLYFPGVIDEVRIFNSLVLTQSK